MVKKNKEETVITITINGKKLSKEVGKIKDKIVKKFEDFVSDMEDTISEIKKSKKK